MLACTDQEMQVLFSALMCGATVVLVVATIWYARTAKNALVEMKNQSALMAKRDAMQSLRAIRSIQAELEFNSQAVTDYKTLPPLRTWTYSHWVSICFLTGAAEATLHAVRDAYHSADRLTIAQGLRRSEMDASKLAKQNIPPALKAFTEDPGIQAFIAEMEKAAR